MSDNIQKLIQLLKKISNDKSIKIEYNYYDNHHPDIIISSNLANECLITDDGYPNINNILLLKQQGFRVFPGKIDRFGWLNGCIQLPGGIIVFG
jgi:hypothetical protein